MSVSRSPSRFRFGPCMTRILCALGKSLALSASGGFARGEDYLIARLGDSRLELSNTRLGLVMLHRRAREVYINLCHARKGFEGLLHAHHAVLTAHPLYLYLSLGHDCQLYLKPGGKARERGQQRGLR